MAVGGGHSLSLMVFACVRPFDGSPVLVILDAGASPFANPEVKAAAACGFEEVEEVELSTRCCTKSVVSANPHAVWINASEVKAFVRSRGGTRVAARNKSLAAEGLAARELAAGADDCGSGHAGGKILTL